MEKEFIWKNRNDRIQRFVKEPIIITEHNLMEHGKSTLPVQCGEDTADCREQDCGDGRCLKKVVLLFL